MSGDPRWSPGIDWYLQGTGFTVTQLRVIQYQFLKKVLRWRRISSIFDGTKFARDEWKDSRDFRGATNRHG
jgi:hypothetical protein